MHSEGNSAGNEIFRQGFRDTDTITVTVNSVS